MQPNEVYQKQLYNIGVYEEETVLTDLTGDAPRHFVVDEKELARLFNLKQPVVLRPDPGLLLFEAGRRTERYVFDVPRRKKPWQMLLRPDCGKAPKVVKMFLPGFLLEIEVAVKAGGRQVSALKALCYAGSRVQDGSVLYDMPLPNFSGGRMCLGGVEVKVPPEGSVLEAGLSAIFDSEFNNHSSLVGKKGVPFPRYLKQHGGRAPLRTLKRLGRFTCGE